MVVMGIMGIIFGIGIPSFYRVFKQEGMRKTVWEIQEVLANARRKAIIQGTETRVVFHPREGQLDLSGGAGPAPASADSMPGEPPPAPAAGSGLSATIPKNIMVEMLDVNLSEYKDAENAYMRFFPNGTADELTLILRSEDNEWRKISVEVTTGLASVQSDPHKFK